MFNLNEKYYSIKRKEVVITVINKISNIKRIICIATTLTLAAGVIGGCGPKKLGKDETNPVKIKYWCELPGEVATHKASLNDTEVYKELQKRTGVEIAFIHPAAGSTTEQLNVMLASRDLPDVIERDWSAYAGAEEGAANDGILMDITDYVKKSAPNFTSYIKNKIPNAERWVTSNDRYYIIPNLEADTKYVTTVGPLIRKDLLDKFNLEVPETIDEWENVLRTFKKNGVKYPLSFYKDFLRWYAPFECAYGVTEYFIQRDGKITYGYIEPEMKEFVLRMRSWIEEGLVDSEYMTMDGTTYNGKVLNGDVGAWVGTLDDMADKELGLKNVVPEVSIVAAPYMTLNKGEDCKVVYINRRDGYTYANAAGITTANKHPEETVKMFDYMFTDEGARLMNFGIEGKSYEMIDGKPKFTELITNNPDGIRPLEARALWTRATAPGRVELEYMDQIYESENQQKAAQMWSNQATKYEHAATWRACYKLTAEEAGELNDVIGQVTTYGTENFSKFLIGAKPMEEWDSFVQEIKNLGVDKVINIYQTAYDRVMEK